MKLLLKACFGSLDSNGNLIAKDLVDKDSQLLAEILDGIEIDGIGFRIKFNGKLKIWMEDDNLSELIKPNYSQKPIVGQIKPKKQEAKFTARVLNKFIRKTNKILSKEPINKMKSQPINVVLIKEVEKLDEY